MTVTTTTRMGVYRWSSDDDEVNRDQFDLSHANLEARSARWGQGTTGARPAAALQTERMFYLATDQGDSNWRPIYYSDGATWYELNTFGSPTAMTAGVSSSDGTAFRNARADHVHSLPGFANPVATGTSLSGGSGSLFARSNHVHTIGAGSVTAGALAAGAIDNSNAFAPGILGSAQFEDGSVTRNKLASTERTPVGAIFMFLGTVAPSGYLMLDGSLVSKTTYANLYAVVGGAFGESGANFNLPNFQNRSPLGWGTRNIGATGGQSSLALTSGQLPAHTHTGTTALAGGHTHTMGTAGAHVHTMAHTHDMSHNHTPAGIAATGGTAFPYRVPGSGGTDDVYNAGSNVTLGWYTYPPTQQFNGSTGAASNANTTSDGSHSHSLSSTADHSHSITTNSAGSNSTVNIENPFAVVSFIVKY